jgi:hypothetical protein
MVLVLCSIVRVSDIYRRSARDASQGTEGSRSQEPSTPRSVNRTGTFILFEENGPAFDADEVSCFLAVL